MQKEREQFLLELDACKDFYLETTRLSGAVKALNEIIGSTQDPEERVQMKNILRGLFRQLMTDLYIIVEDGQSKINLTRLIKRFEELYGRREKELGVKINIDREKEYLAELKKDIALWKDLRMNFCSHYNYSFRDNWESDIDNISIFLVSVGNIIDITSKTIAIPEAYPEKTKSYSFSFRTSTNLEEEYYKKLRKHLSWKEG